MPGTRSPSRRARRPSTAPRSRPGWGPGDQVYTSPLTFMASANCARYVGAQPGLVDIDASTLNIDVASVPADADGVVPVHYAGLPVDLAASRSHRPRVV